MTIDAALIIALLISLGCNLIGFYYIRDLLGRLGWLTQNLANLSELIIGYQKHIKGVYELEKFYGDDDIKLLVEHTNDLIEVMDDYLEVGLDSELIEEELQTKDETNDTEETPEGKDKKNVFYSDTRGRDSEVLRGRYNISGEV
tara:strand:- start:624 stop:1055 length:432 start_codon:yes stop_codon:yes gene_type:complete